MFDLHSGNILGLIFSLKHSFWTTDFVKNQLKSLRVERWEQIGLSVCELTGHQVEELTVLCGLHGSTLGIADLSTIVLARSKTAALVTRDYALGQLAAAQGIKIVHSLDVMEELVDNEVLTPDDATDALRQIMDRRGRMFPQRRSLELIHKWTGA